jgi:hypothetical protein
LADRRSRWFLEGGVNVGALVDHYADFKWIKVKKYAMDESLSWEDRYRQLDEHHVQETTFLIEEVRKLAAKLDEV